MTNVAPAAAFMNPVAGRGKALRRLAEVRAHFALRNYSARIIETDSADDFRQQVRAAKADGCSPLVAMGGDGTLQLLVREVIASDVPVGVIPTGGGNDFAAALGIPANSQAAVDVIVRGKTRNVDVVNVRFANGVEQIYLGGGGIGLDAQATRLANGRFVRWPGRLRYLASAVAALRGFAGVELQAEFPESDLPKTAKRVLLAAVLNAPTYGGGLRLVPEAALDDGKLEVVLIEMLSNLEVLAILPRMLITGELKTKRITRFRAASVNLQAGGDPWFQGDGELLGRTPAQIQVAPKALRILAP